MAKVQDLKISSSDLENYFKKYLNKTTVFILSPDDGTRNHIASFLRRAPRPPETIIQAKNLTEARSRLLKHEVDLVISEFKFANEKGISVLDKLRKMAGEDGLTLKCVLITREMNQKTIEVTDPRHVALLEDPFKFTEMKKAIVQAFHKQKNNKVDQKVINEGKKHFKEMSYDKAEECFQKSLDSGLNSESLFFMGQIKMIHRKFDEAEKYFSRAVDLNPKNNQFQIQLFLAQYELEKYFEAYKTYKKSDRDLFIMSGQLGYLINMCLKSGNISEFSVLLRQFEETFDLKDKKTNAVVFDAIYDILVNNPHLGKVDVWELFNNALAIGLGYDHFEKLDFLVNKFFDDHSELSKEQFFNKMKDKVLDHQFSGVLDLLWAFKNETRDEFLKKSLMTLKKEIYHPLVYYKCLKMMKNEKQFASLMEKTYQDAVSKFPQFKLEFDKIWEGSKAA